MSEVGKQEVVTPIYEFAGRDPGYRSNLLRDPKRLLETQMQQSLPASLNVKVAEETSDTMYLIAPYVAGTGDELSDEDLEKVAGGKGKSGSETRNERDNLYICNDTKGIGTRVEVTTNL